MDLNLALPHAIVLPLAGYFLLANLLALGLFAARRADTGAGEWTGAETRALFLALMGGWPGAVLGRMLFGRRDEPRGFGTVLGLSVLFLPLILALPLLIDAAPGWVGKAVASYTAQYSAAPVTGGATPDMTGIVASEGDSTDSTITAISGAAAQSVEGATQAPAKAASLPTRFGPASTGKKKSSQKTLKVGN